MLRKLAYIFSVLFHPILLPTWIMVVLMVNGQLVEGVADGTLRWNYLLTNFGVTFLLPFIALAVMKRKKAIGSFEMETRSERLMPLMVMSLFFYTAYYIFRHSAVNVMYNYFMLCAVLLCAVAIAVTMRWKISLHSLGWGVFSACMVIMAFKEPETYMPWLCASILVSGLVGSARLYLDSHTPAQVYAGFAAGFAVGIIPLLIIS